VVVAQVRDTDYRYRREYPVSGSAYLKVLVPYKTEEPLDLIEVYEEGLHDHECYFPNPTVFEEGRRYLLFLKTDPEKPERFRGIAAGCALDILVARDNSYALRLPVTAIDLSDPLAEYGQAYEFADSYAVVNDETLNSVWRDELLEDGWIEPTGDGYVYTSGVPLTSVRHLMFQATTL